MRCAAQTWIGTPAEIEVTRVPWREGDGIALALHPGGEAVLLTEAQAMALAIALQAITSQRDRLIVPGPREDWP